MKEIFEEFEKYMIDNNLVIDESSYENKIDSFTNTFYVFIESKEINIPIEYIKFLVLTGKVI